MLELLESPIPTLRVDAYNGRFYTEKLSDSESIENPEKPFLERDCKISMTTLTDKTIPKDIYFTIAASNHPGGWKGTREDWDGKARDGTMVHDLNARLINGETLKIRGATWWDAENEEEIPIEKRHYKRLVGFRNFWNDYNPKPIAIELQLLHPDLPFAGTLDLLLEINGELWLIDEKTGAYYREHEIQTTGYGMLCRAHGIKPDHYAGLYLPEGYKTPRGSYKLTEFQYQPNTLMHYYKAFLLHQGKPIPQIPEPLPTDFSLYEDE